MESEEGGILGVPQRPVPQRPHGRGIDTYLLGKQKLL